MIEAFEIDFLLLAVDFRDKPRAVNINSHRDVVPFITIKTLAHDHLEMRVEMFWEALAFRIRRGRDTGCERFSTFLIEFKSRGKTLRIDII